MVEIFEIDNIKIINCDMFSQDGFSQIPNNSIEAIITDFPYGTLNKRNEWDKVIDYIQFWKEAKELVMIIPL